MITGFLSRWEAEKQFFPQTFSDALHYMTAHNMRAMAPGKYPLQGDSLFIVLEHLTTTPVEQKRCEIHNRYIDIHVLLQGEELHLYHPLPPTGAPLEDALRTKDAAFYTCPPDTQRLVLQEGQYAVYLPGERHASACAVHEPQGIIKAVVKILVPNAL